MLQQPSVEIMLKTLVLVPVHVTVSPDAFARPKPHPTLQGLHNPDDTLPHMNFRRFQVSPSQNLTRIPDHPRCWINSSQFRRSEQLGSTARYSTLRCSYSHHWEHGETGRVANRATSRAKTDPLRLGPQKIPSN